MEKTHESLERALQQQMGMTWFALNDLCPDDLGREVSYLAGRYTAGQSLIPAPFDFNTAISGVTAYQAQPGTEQDEIAAAAQAVAQLLPQAITAYHQRLPRQAALAVVQGALTMEQSFAWTFTGVLCPFAGYQVDAARFASDWSSANPDQRPIYTNDGDWLP